MNKKFIFILIFLIAAGVIGIFAYYASIPKIPAYSDEPKDWVKTRVAERVIDVKEATKGRGYLQGDLRELQLILTANYTETILTYSGWYDNEFFSTAGYTKDGKTYLGIGNNMKPNDKVMEIFVAERIIEDEHKVFIFVDDGWKRAMPNTNIIWGRYFDRIKRFSFREIADGIYMDEINDDPSRFGYNYQLVYSGILIGNLTKEQAQKGSAEGVVVVKFQ